MKIIYQNAVHTHVSTYIDRYMSVVWIFETQKVKIINKKIK